MKYPQAATQAQHGPNFHSPISSKFCHARNPLLLYLLFKGPFSALGGGKLFAHIRKSKFKLPTLASCPLITAAAGTGLAPFRAFITERVRLKVMGKPVGEMLIFFGCRHPDEDFIYRAEIEEMERALDGRLCIVTVFSRVNRAKKVYVQDRVQETDAEVLRLLSEGAKF